MKKTKKKTKYGIRKRIAADCALGDVFGNVIRWKFTPTDPQPSAPPSTEPESILAEAERVTSGDRQNQYGPPDQDFRRIAAMWSALNGVPFTPKEVALFMVCVKLSRETHQRKRDNWVDIAGYAKCGSLCGEGGK